MQHYIRVVLLGTLFVIAATGCEQRQDVSTTRGSVIIECDESLMPVMQLQAEDFERSYTEAAVRLCSVQAREAIADFVDDSVRVIVTARPFNKEERDVIATAKIEYKEFNVALDAVAVIMHKDNPTKELRISELDSIFSGFSTRWSWKTRNNLIDVAICGLNSSTNEVFRSAILDGKTFTLTATRFDSSQMLVEYVLTNPNAIGIVGLSWLRDYDGQLRVAGLGDPNGRPDSTQPMGRYYPPLQAHVYRKYYPITTPVYIYTREILMDVGLGFIAYVSSIQGQKIFQVHGLVPATMPVRLVVTTSQPVK